MLQGEGKNKPEESSVKKEGNTGTEGYNRTITKGEKTLRSCWCSCIKEVRLLSETKLLQYSEKAICCAFIFFPLHPITRSPR
jgi:hypothetical protein